MGGGGERLYTYRYTVTTRMTYALRWAAMRAILTFHNCEGQSHKTVSTDHNLLKRKESQSGFEPRSLRLPALPLGQTRSRFLYVLFASFYTIVLHIWVIDLA